MFKTQHSKPIICMYGSRPTHFTTSPNLPGKFCGCHSPESTSLLHPCKVTCDGTEEKSYCLLGCEACHEMIKEKNERNKKELADLQLQLFNQHNASYNLKNQTARVKKELELAKKQIERLESELKKTRKGTLPVDDAMVEMEQAEDVDGKARSAGLVGSENYTNLFTSPILRIKLHHPKAPKDLLYNIHITRLTQISTHFSSWVRTCTLNRSYPGIPDTYDSTFEWHPLAFKYFVEFVYTNTYNIAAGHKEVECLLHTLIYFLADRLGCDTLMSLSLGNLRPCLEREDYVVKDRVVVKMVETTYEGTQPRNEDEMSDSSSESGTPHSGGSTTGSEAENTWEDSISELSFNDDDITAAEKMDKLLLKVHREESPHCSDELTECWCKPQLTPKARDHKQLMSSLDLDEEPAEVVTTDQHPMRVLVSRYAAQRLKALNERPDFRALLRRFPEFTVDMMIAREDF